MSGRRAAHFSLLCSARHASIGGALIFPRAHADRDPCHLAAARLAEEVRRAAGQAAAQLAGVEEVPPVPGPVMRGPDRVAGVAASAGGAVRQRRPAAGAAAAAAPHGRGPAAAAAPGAAAAVAADAAPHWHGLAADAAALGAAAVVDGVPRPGSAAAAAVPRPHRLAVAPEHRDPAAER